MYGTIARLKADSAQLEALKTLGERTGLAPGQVGHYVFQTDENPNEFYLVAIFESRDAYWENARSPEQNTRYEEMRALLLEDPVWHDGEIINTLF